MVLHAASGTLPGNFSNRSAETGAKRPAKSFYGKTILQIVFTLPDNFSNRSAETGAKRPAKSFYGKTATGPQKFPPFPN